MAYQVFSEGADLDWNKLYYKIEYETTRSGPNVGVRFKIIWTISRNYYFGYNIKADLWIKGSNFGRIIKENLPNTGSGTALFPKDGSFYWFNNGYTNNVIENCKVDIYSTNGSTINYNSGSPKNIYAPQGFAPSTIISNINFNIGNNLKIMIDDVTQINYNYLLSLDVKKENGQWQNISQITKSEKNFEWDLEEYSSTLYNLLPNSNSAEVRINITTKYGNEVIGTTQKTGTVYVTNSDPEPPVACLSPQEGTETPLNQMSIIAGFGPYNPNSNVLVLYKPASLVAKNGATIEKLIIEANGQIYNVDVGGDA